MEERGSEEREKGWSEEISGEEREGERGSTTNQVELGPDSVSHLLLGELFSSVKALDRHGAQCSQTFSQRLS